MAMIKVVPRKSKPTTSSLYRELSGFPGKFSAEFTVIFSLFYKSEGETGWSFVKWGVFRQGL